MKIKSNIHRSTSSRGFALVVTLSLMILLTVIAVGMLSLSSISLRASGQGVAMATARANARLALMLAIGDLQKSAGVDRRVTATADIRKTARPEKAHWTGVWSTQNWKVNQPATRNFVAWLASDPSPLGRPVNENHVDSPFGAGNSKSKRIEMVGQGTLAATDDRVEVMSIPVATANGMSGSYAYWVGDEGVKARYDMADTGHPNNFTVASRWGAPPKSGIQKIAGMDTYLNVADATLTKTSTFQGIELAQGGATLPPKLFHHVTTDSVGLPVDVRLGGAKQDLSLAFEQPLAEFNALRPFHLDGETNKTGWYANLNASVYNRPEFYPESQRLGYLFMIPADSSGTNRLRGPTWDLLRNHCRLYKKEWEALAWPRKQNASADAIEARGSLPFSYACAKDTSRGVIANRFTSFSGESMLYSRAIKGGWTSESISRVRPAGFDAFSDPLRRTAEKITPLVTRMTFVFGLIRGKFTAPGSAPSPTDPDTVAVSIDPYITIFNPYNRPIEFHSFGCFAAKFNPFTYKIDYTDSAGVPKSTGDFKSSANSYNSGSFSFRLNPATVGGKMRLEPGEIRVISPEKVLTGVKMDRSGATPLSGSALYSEDCGIAITPPNPVVPKSGSAVTLNISGRNSSDSEVDMLDFSMFYPKLHNGSARNVVTDIPPVGNAFLDADSLDDPHVLKMGFSTHSMSLPPRTVGSAQIPTPGNAGQFVAALDMWMKNFDGGGVGVLAQFNPRATAVDPREYDGSHRISPGWEAQFSAITDISVLNLVNASNKGRWGGRSGTVSDLCLYDIPAAPLTSLAQLQHADIGAFPTDAPYAIGNSFPPPAIPLNKLFGTLSLVNGGHTTWGPQAQGDMCWAANEMIWDRFFFSGLNWGTRSRYATQDQAVTAMKDTSQDSPFANPRVQLASHPSSDTRLKAHDTIGEHLAVRGAFNINSTSESAWRAVLAGLDQTELTYRLNGASKTEKFNSPVSRFSEPAGNDTDKFRGFRALTDSQLDALAKEIVVQVKQRGPFMGLSDFVNRRLDNSADNKLGALQAAIDISGVNATLPGAPSPDPVVNVPNKLKSTQAGLPGYVTQADLLSTIGSFISARSDTFKIRAYGETTDKNGKVTARAWCEAVVQRTPEWMQVTNVSPTIANSNYARLVAGDPLFRPFVTNPAFPAVNQIFGRRFQIVQFRWLPEKDV